MEKCPEARCLYTQHYRSLLNKSRWGKKVAKSKGKFPTLVVTDLLRISYFRRALGLAR